MDEIDAKLPHLWRDDVLVRKVCQHQLPRHPSIFHLAQHLALRYEHQHVFINASREQTHLVLHDEIAGGWSYEDEGFPFRYRLRGEETFQSLEGLGDSLSIGNQ